MLALAFRMEAMPEPEPEYRFAPPRRWRFDYAWPHHKVALEVEGGAFTRGRHTRGTGFIKDMEKYSEAAIAGWCVVRVVPEALLTTGVDLVRRALLARRSDVHVPASRTGETETSSSTGAAPLRNYRNRKQVPVTRDRFGEDSNGGCVTKTKERPVIVTTAHRGVFFGYANDTTGEQIGLTKSRLCIYWSSDMGGFMGLAAQGPSKDCRIGPPADITLRSITAVLEVTPDAEQRWNTAKTYK